jgi:hypothetical protein
MTEIFVERQWDPPITATDIERMVATSDECLARNRCVWRGSLLSADGSELFCHFSAPDAESVRVALHEAGSPRGSAWPATIHDAADFTDAAFAQANVLVDRRFEQPAVLAEIQAIEDAGAGCLQTHRVRFVRTYFSSDRKRMMCLYRAPDAESVRIAQREAGMPVERVRAIRQFRP